MTAKDKANELLYKFNNAEGCEWDFYETDEGREMGWRMAHSLAKQCALIAVNEMLDDSVTLSIGCYDYKGVREQWIKYWQEVKQEIENL